MGPQGCRREREGEKKRGEWKVEGGSGRGAEGRRERLTKVLLWLFIEFYFLPPI